jgi:hypothetical protein
MAKIVHYVLAINLDEKTKYLDEEATQASFWDGLTVFDDQSNQWEELTGEQFDKAMAILNDKEREIG